jgi:hypothetical protein
MMYVRTLADSKLAYSTIKKYVGSVRSLHKMHNVEAPAYKTNYHYNRTMQGIKRELGGTTHQKLHMTVEILSLMATRIDKGDRNERMFFAACLLAFFTFFRKSSFTCPSEKGFNPLKHLRRRDITFQSASLATVESQWSKTNQFRERLMKFPIVASVRGDLDAVTHLRQYFAEDQCGGDEPAFRVWKKGYKAAPLTGNWFVKKLKEVLVRCGVDATLYSGHSFRSGGATWAFTCGLPTELIKAQGDWTSDAYMRYLRLPWECRIVAAARLAGRRVEV